MQNSFFKKPQNEKEDTTKISALSMLKLFGIIILALLSAGLIFWVNFEIIQGWFFKNGPANIGSIEVSYVSMGKFLVQFGFNTWAPFWYFGFPFHIFYTPLLPLLEAFLNKFYGVPLWEAYRFITGAGFILGPVSLFLLGWQITKKVYAGLVAGMLYTVMPTIFYFILPSGEVASDRFAVDFFDPRRFTILVRWGEGPHLFSLIFVPIAGLFFARLLEKFSRRDLILAAIFLGLAALTNAIGLFSTILLIGSMAFAKFCIEKQLQMKSFLLVFLTGILAFGLISFWYDITFLSTFFKEGGNSALGSLFPWGFVGLLVIIMIVYFVIHKFIRNFAIASSLIWFLILFTVVYTYYSSALPDESYRRIELLPQALRYNIEVDLSLSLLAGVLFGSIFSFLSKKTKLFDYLGWGLAILLSLFMALYIQPYINTSNKAASAVVDLSNTQESKVASWVDQNLDHSKGERVFAPGNYSFYLNWFNDSPQLRGALFQASTHFWPDHIYYQVSHGEDPEILKAWLIAANVKYTIVPGPGSHELYKDIKSLDRFKDFPKKQEIDGDIYYETPQTRPSLAKPVNLETLKNLKVPQKGDDKEPILAYADWVDKSSSKTTDLQVLSHDRYRITGEAGPGEGILVQMTADWGWSAKDNLTGSGISTGKDTLGFLMLYPKPGKVDISLYHTVAWDVYLGYLITFATIGLVIWMFIFGKKIKFIRSEFKKDQIQDHDE